MHGNQVIDYPISVIFYSDVLVNMHRCYIVLSPHILVLKYILRPNKEENQRSTSHVVDASTATMLTRWQMFGKFLALSP